MDTVIGVILFIAALVWIIDSFDVDMSRPAPPLTPMGVVVGIAAIWLLLKILAKWPILWFVVIPLAARNFLLWLAAKRYGR